MPAPLCHLHMWWVTKINQMAAGKLAAWPLTGIARDRRSGRFRGEALEACPVATEVSPRREPPSSLDLRLLLRKEMRSSAALEPKQQSCAQGSDFSSVWARICTTRCCSTPSAGHPAARTLATWQISPPEPLGCDEPVPVCRPGQKTKKRERLDAGRQRLQPRHRGLYHHRHHRN